MRKMIYGKREKLDLHLVKDSLSSKASMINESDLSPNTKAILLNTQEIF